MMPDIQYYITSFKKITDTIKEVINGKETTFAILSALSVFDEDESIKFIRNKDLKLSGILYNLKDKKQITDAILINGRYISKDNKISESPGYFIIGITKELTTALAKELGLESFIFNNELIYLTKPLIEKYDLTKIIFGKEAIKEYNYSILRDNNSAHAFSFIKIS